MALQSDATSKPASACARGAAHILPCHWEAAQEERSRHDSPASSATSLGRQFQHGAIGPLLITNAHGAILSPPMVVT